MVDYTMRLATARNPRFSERKQVDMRVQSLDMTSVLDAAQRRLEARQGRRELDVTPAPLQLAAGSAALAELL